MCGLILMKTFYLFFGINFVLSLLLLLLFKSHTTPINRVNRGRTFGISNRELIGVPAISILLLYGIKRYYKESINLYLIPQALMYMLITAIIVHVIFGVRTALNHKLGLSAKPNGTGILPYNDY